MRTRGARRSALMVRAVVGVGVYVAIPLYAVPAAAGFLAGEARTRARRALGATGEAIRKIMVGGPRWLKRGRTRVRRAGQLHEFGRWLHKEQARCRKGAARGWKAGRKAVRRTAAGGMRRLARLRDTPEGR